MATYDVESGTLSQTWTWGDTANTLTDARQLIRDIRAVGSMPDCFRCGEAGAQWFDGPGAGALRRAECGACEYRSWHMTNGAMCAPQG